MSWLSKVSDFAGAAENLLNKLDEKTGDAIQQARDAKPRTRKSSSASIPAMSINMPESVVAEEFGRTTQSIPSRAQSDYVGSSWKGKNNYDHSIIQPGETATTASESWSMVLNSNDSSVKPEEDSKSQKADCDANLKSQLWAKESQITVIKSKLAETERKLEKRNQEYYELKAEKQILENRLENQNDSNQEIDSIQELKVARKMAQSQKEKAVEECNSLKRKIVGFEEEIRAMVEQLRLAKFNLNENKKEFDEYKTKAQKILNAKEKLVESLKLEQGIGTSDRPVHLLQAEVEEIKVERDFVKSDLESAQLQIYNLRSDAEDLEVQIRDLQTQLNEEKRNHLEEKQSWETSMGLLNEKIECFRIENEFTKQEMKRQNDLNNAKLQEKNNEIRKAVEEAKARLREEQALRQNDDSHSQLGEMLLQKQQELEDAQRSNQVLSVRLDRLQKAVSARETSISMEYQNASSSSLQLNNSPSHSFLSNIKHTQTRQALQAIDSTALKLFTMLRNYPSSRLFFVFYFIIMHLWLFFILITYTPEIH